MIGYFNLVSTPNRHVSNSFNSTTSNSTIIINTVWTASKVPNPLAEYSMMTKRQAFDNGTWAKFITLEQRKEQHRRWGHQWMVKLIFNQVESHLPPLRLFPSHLGPAFFVIDVAIFAWDHKTSYFQLDTSEEEASRSSQQQWCRRRDHLYVRVYYVRQTYIEAHLVEGAQSAARAKSTQQLCVNDFSMQIAISLYVVFLLCVWVVWHKKQFFVDET